MNQGIVINITFCDDFYKIIRLEKILLKKYHLNHEILENEELEEALGGLEILVEKYKAIFNSIEFHDLMDVFSFLVESLVSLKVLNSKYFITNFSCQYDVVSLAKMENNQILVLKEGKNEDFLLLSFLNKNTEKIKTRNNPYFEDYLLDKNEWINNSIIALNEYLTIVKNNLALNKTLFWVKFISEWEENLRLR